MAAKKAEAESTASKELPKQSVLTADTGEASIGWTSQTGAPMPEDVVHSEGAVPKDALPSPEGLAAVGVPEPNNYLANVVVAE
jgi:hypothetical protein